MRISVTANLRSCWCTLLLSAIATTCAAQSQQAPIEKTARQTLERLEQRQYKEIVACFSEHLRAALPEEKLRNYWEGIQAKAGRLKDPGQPTFKERKNDLRGVLFRAQFEKSNVEVEVVFNRKGEIAGLLMSRKPSWW